MKTLLIIPLLCSLAFAQSLEGKTGVGDDEVQGTVDRNGSAICTLAIRGAKTPAAFASSLPIARTALHTVKASVLLSESANGIVYAGICGTATPATWCSGSDIGAWINAATANLPTVGGYKTGTILLPNANGTTWSTPVVIGPGTNLLGQGSLASSFSCKVSRGACLTVNHSGSTGQFSFTVEPNQVLQGFSINGNGATGQNILHAEDGTNVSYSDLFLDGASESGGVCVWLEDVNHWTERTTWKNVSTGYGCNIGLRFTVQSGDSYNSFGYNRFIDFKLNPNGAQTAISIENNAYVYNGTYHFTVNKSGVGSKVFHMQNTALFYEDELQLDGEEDGSGGDRLDITSAKNQLVYWGNINFAAITDNITAGAVVTRLLDNPHITTPNLIYNSTQMKGEAALSTDYIKGYGSNGFVTINPFSNRVAYAFAVGNDSNTRNFFTVSNPNGLVQIYNNLQLQGTEALGTRGTLLQGAASSGGTATFPSGSGTVCYTANCVSPLATSFTTSTATSDNVTVTGMTPSGHCSLQATNSGAAAGLSSVYVSAKTTNQITVTHAATSGWTFDVICTPY